MNKGYKKFIKFILEGNKGLFVWYLVNIFAVTLISVVVINLFNIINTILITDQLITLGSVFLIVIFASGLSFIAVARIRNQEFDIIVRSKELIIDYLITIDFEQLENPQIKQEILKKKNFIERLTLNIFQPLETIITDIFVIIANFVIINTIKLDFILILIVCFTVFLNTKIQKLNQQHLIEMLNQVALNDKRYNFYNYFLTKLSTQKDLRKTAVGNVMFDDASENIDGIVGKFDQYLDKTLVVRIKQIFLIEIQNLMIYLYIAYLYYNHSITLVDVGTLYLATNAMVSSLKSIFNSYVSFEGLNKFSEMIGEVFDGDVVEQLDQPIETIEFRNVSYRYPGQQEFTLKNINFTWTTAQNLAIVGRNGEGKSTLTKLIAGVYKPTEGQILINGKAMTNVKWSTNFGILHQNARLIEAKLKDNFVLETELEQLFKDFELEKYLNLLDKHVSTLFDEDGVNLSKGEKQKILLCKIYQLDCDIYIFDEPTSALDPLAEADYIRLLNEKFNDNKKILIVHKMALINNYEQIIVLNDKTVDQVADFATLLRDNQTFNSLYNAHKQLYS